MNMAGNRSLLQCTAESTGPCHNREVFTNNTCVTHNEQPFEYDMFDAADLAAFGPRNTSMPYTARNKHYLGVDFRFGPGWNHSEAVAHGVDSGGEVHAEMAVSDVERHARLLLRL